MGQLLTDALVIKNETTAGANTATRVGGWMQDAATSIEALESDDIILVRTKADFGTFTNGVASLQAGKTYMVTTDVDLTGDRLEAIGVCNLFGMSSETTSLTSTGLTAGVPMITSEYTIVIKSINFKDVDTCFSINGNVRTVALDWRAVNFSGIENVGVVNTCDNFILETGAFLGSQGLRFTGTIGTIGISNSLFRSTGNAGSIIELDANCVITRRFRIIYSAIIVLGSSTGIDVSVSATVPVEGFILDTINFSGAGTYLPSITFTSEEALFVNCVGIKNTTAIAGLYWIDNATPTTIAVQGDLYRALGTSSVSSFNQKFTHIPANTSVRYDSTIPRLMRIQSSCSILATNNNIIGIYIGVKKGASIVPADDLIPESEVYITASGTRPDGAFVQAIVELEQNDEVYLIVQNTSGTGSVTVSFLNTIVERTN